MSRRREINWRREWEEEQIEIESEQRRIPEPPHPDDWRDVPVILLRQPDPEVVRRFCRLFSDREDENLPDRLAKCHVRRFVIQTCRWREDWDECRCWSPEDGRSIVAFANFSQAKEVSKHLESFRQERFGVVEIQLDHPRSRSI
jgi:hypothetical protein